MSVEVVARVDALERGQAAMGEAVEQVRAEVSAIGGKVDRLVDALSSTDERTAARAQAVKVEIRDESDRKARDRSDLFKNGLALLGGIAIVVSAIGGPYLGQLHATSVGQAEDSKAIAGVRELVATARADIDRQHDSGEIQRERNRTQDAELLDYGQRLARLEARAGEPVGGR